MGFYRGLERQIVEIGGAPDRAAAAPVRDLAGIDRDHADRAERVKILDALALIMPWNSTILPFTSRTPGAGS